MADARDVPITIEAGPNGITVKVGYTGSVDTIPTVIERLRALGVLDLVMGAGSQAPKPASKPKAQRLAPDYNGDGDPICPTHKRVLKEGRWGLFCSAKNTDGEYCSHKFETV